MKIFTFEEWERANRDLTDEVWKETHRNALYWDTLKKMYDAQVLRDKERLAKWNEAVDA